jgi:hypothetical protein
MSQELLQELSSATSELTKTLSSFSNADFNTIPNGGGWTPGQVGDHLFKSDYLVLKALYGESKPAERKPDEHVKTLREQFLDFNTKFKSPDSIIPECGGLDKEGLLLSLEATRARMNEVILKFNLEEVCLHVDEPALEGLTRIELLNFVVVHTKRHIHQLQKMKIPHHEWRGIPKLTAS